MIYWLACELYHFFIRAESSRPLTKLDQEIFIGLTLKKLVNLYRRKVVEVQSHIPGVRGITIVQGWVICFIYDQTDEQKDVFQRDIELELDIRKSSATTLLQRMEKNGFIVRKPMSHDARWKKLELTVKAVNFRNELKSRMVHIENQAVDGLTNEEISHFMKVADVITKNLE